MRTKKWLLVGVCIILVLSMLISLSCEESTTPSTPSTSAPETLDIGVAVSLTGWIGTWCTLLYHEAQEMETIINDNGGITINGQQYLINLVVEDGKSSQDGTNQAVTRLVYNDKVKFVIGPECLWSLGTNSITEPNNILRVKYGNSNMTGELDENTPYTFVAFGGGAEFSQACVNYLASAYPDVKTIVIVFPDDGSAINLTPVITQMLKNEGITVLGDTILYANDATDFSPLAAKIVARNADGIFWVNGIATQMGATLKALHELGYNGVFALAAPISAADVMTVSGKSAATNFFSVGFDNTVPGLPAITTQLMQQCEANYNTTTISFQIATSLYTLVQVIEQAQSIDPTVVRDAWEEMTTVDTLFGPGTMGGLQTYGINHVVAHPLPIMILNNGNVEYGPWQIYSIP